MTEVAYDPRRLWLEHPYRACKGADQDVVFSGPNAVRDKPTDARKKVWDDWINEHCAMCPVLKECHRDTLGEEFGIWGGRSQHQRHLARKRLLVQAKKWGEKKRAYWGGEIARLLGEGWTYAHVTQRTGIPKSLAFALLKDHQERLKEEQAEREEKRRQSALEADRESRRALGGLTRTAFPDKPGNKDLWVRHDGQIYDASYKAHSEDDRYIKAEMRRLRTIVWAPVEQCQVYRPVVKRTEKKVGRKPYGRVRAAA